MSPRSALTVLAAVLLLPACLELHEDAAPEEQQKCTACHGDPSRGASALLNSAPPFDLKGNTDEGYPGVGAHDVHLYASPTHPAFSCDECHRVPEGARDPGHIDSAPPAELDFGPLASQGSKPKYDATSRRCSNTYCHGASSSVWTRPASSDAACGSCHGLPPALPHPQAENCSTCHGQVIDDERRFVDSRLHVNGRVEVEDPGCSGCHGSDDSAAPPRDTQGNQQPAARGVGAHEAHLFATLGRPLACEECHRVPEETASPGHLDDDPLDVVLTGIATTGERDAHYDSMSLRCVDSWCHGPSAVADSPTWTDAEDLSCQSCHGMPPGAPHPPVTNCSLCHSEVTSAAPTSDLRVEITDPMRHVDGIVDVATPTDCFSCHGDPDGTESWQSAPPKDTHGLEETSAMGVGAHRAHLVENGRTRPLQCSECHVVPETVDAAGHMDTPLPAELAFTGIANAFEAEPQYDSGTCQNTFCHGGSFIGKRPSGGDHVHPTWNVVDGSQVTCGGCHGMPPPAPHPQPADNCSECHHNIAPNNREFLFPLMHVDGTVTFFLPD